MKSVLLAYLLWCLGGPLGLYKLYLGRPFMDNDPATGVIVYVFRELF